LASQKTYHGQLLTTWPQGYVSGKIVKKIRTHPQRCNEDFNTNLGINSGFCYTFAAH